MQIAVPRGSAFAYCHRKPWMSVGLRVRHAAARIGERGTRGRKIAKAVHGQGACMQGAGAQPDELTRKLVTTAYARFCAEHAAHPSELVAKRFALEVTE